MNSRFEAPTHLAGGKPAGSDDFILSRRHRLAVEWAPPGGGVLLDYGCGNGAQTLLFSSEFSRTLGVDVNQDYLHHFAQRLRESNLEERSHPLRYDGLRVPLADASVDYAISFEVLEHVESENEALSELHRVLRPGGVLVISVPNRWWLFETHGAKLPLLPWNRVPFFSWMPKSLHDRYARARIYRRREIVSKLQNHGFEPRRSGYITAPMDVIKWIPLQRALRATLFREDETSIPFLATAVLVVAVRQ